MKKQLTLCMVHQGEKILLGMKKRGFGAGKWNGFGGKCEEGETIQEAAERELEEETGIRAKHMEKVGVLDFAFLEDPKVLEVHVFRIGEFDGEPRESEEMRPQWFSTDTIPFSNMWPDDIFWIPLLLEGKKFKGRFLFDKPSTVEENAQIIEQELGEVDICE